MPNLCIKHGASYISDFAGSLSISIKDQNLLGSYKQDGDSIADFLYCQNCGVLIGAAYKGQEKLYAAFNSVVIDDGVRFGEKITVSPKKLSDDEKMKRWKEVWFQDVQIVSG